MNLDTEMNPEAVDVRTATDGDAQAVHEVLADAFAPFKDQYTEEAYNITIMTPVRIQERIQDREYDVLVAYLNGRRVGTATLQYRVDDVYMCSMGVSPDAQGKGVGKRLLEAIEERARQKGSKTVTLECFGPLKRAIALYKKARFRITGKKRRYYGIETFEMIRDLPRG